MAPARSGTAPTAHLPTTQRAAVLIETGRIEVQERPVPVPGVGEVLVQVLAVGVCGSDVHYFSHGRIGDFVVEEPLILGHEASGRIVGVGAGVAEHRVGERVAIEPGQPCGTCEQCRLGHYNLCPDVQFLATPPIDGAFAEYIIVQKDFAHPIPDSFSDDAGALIEPLAVGVWANQKADTNPASRVLITGAGPVGLLAASVARSRGASAILISDVSAERLAGATHLGFESVRPGDARITELRPTVFIECSGSPAATTEGIRSLAAGGRAVLVGMAPTTDISVPIAVIQSREIILTGTFRYANVYPAAISLVESGRINLDQFASKTFDLDHVADALTAPGSDPSIIKAIVRPGNH